MSEAAHPYDVPATHAHRPGHPTDQAQTCSHAASPARHSPARKAGPSRVNVLVSVDVVGCAAAPALAALGWAPAPAFGRVGHGGSHTSVLATGTSHRDATGNPNGNPSGNSTGNGTATGTMSGICDTARD